jgi:haloacetate dehalogenase
MAGDQLFLMSSLGFEQFHIAGHDRGGRVTHRLAFDAPLRAISLTMMDIVPTHHLLDQLKHSVAT